MRNQLLQIYGKLLITLNENTPKYTFKQSTQVSLGLLFIEFNSMSTKQKPLKTLSNLKQSNCKVYTFFRVNIYSPQISLGKANSRPSYAVSELDTFFIVETVELVFYYNILFVCHNPSKMYL